MNRRTRGEKLCKWQKVCRCRVPKRTESTARIKLEKYCSLHADSHVHLLIWHNSALSWGVGSPCHCTFKAEMMHSVIAKEYKRGERERERGGGGGGSGYTHRVKMLYVVLMECLNVSMIVFSSSSIGSCASLTNTAKGKGHTHAQPTYTPRPTCTHPGPHVHTQAHMYNTSHCRHCRS